MNPFITVTGADEQTDLSKLSQLDAEIGLLFTMNPDGRNRYPSRQWLVRATSTLPRVAIHICGRKARADLHRGWLGDILAHAQRIQVNGLLSEVECEDLCEQYYTHTVITQHHEANDLREVPSLNHALLVDASGGRGIVRSGWPIVVSGKLTGYAGGLSSDNIPSELPKIESVATDGWWIDMEGKLRISDWFSIERAAAAVASFHANLRTATVATHGAQDAAPATQEQP